MYLTLPSKNAYIFGANVGILGFFLIPIIMTSFSFCAEMTYPVSEALSQGVMVLFSQIYGTGISYLATYMIEQDYPLIALTFLICQFCVSAAISLFMTEDLKRLNLGKQDIQEKMKSGRLTDKDMADLNRVRT